jgi:hypothetical protein
MNIDFDARPGFSTYVLLLMFSGLVMIALATPAVKRTSMGYRVLNGIAGAGFFGYGFYLTFIFDGGTYLIFFKAFILPVLLIVNTIRGMRSYEPPVPPAYSGAGDPARGAGYAVPPPGYAVPPPGYAAPPPGYAVPPPAGYAPPPAPAGYAPPPVPAPANPAGGYPPPPPPPVYRRPQPAPDATQP